MNQHKSDKQKRKAPLIHLLLKCSQYIERETNTILRDFELKQQQFAVLNEIVLNGPVSQKELVDNLLYGKSNISRIVKLLLEKNLAQIMTLPTDRRLTMVAETYEGREVWKSCAQAFENASVEYLSTISGDEVKITMEQLRMIVKSLQIHRRKSI